jgi:hypothetical protein
LDSGSIIDGWWELIRQLFGENNSFVCRYLWRFAQVWGLDNEIDLDVCAYRHFVSSEIPEWTDEMWKRAVRGEALSSGEEGGESRLDADVIAWLKKDGRDIRVGRIGCCGNGC